MPPVPDQQPASSKVPKQSYSRVVKNGPVVREKKRIPNAIILVLFVALIGAGAWVWQSKTGNSVLGLVGLNGRSESAPAESSPDSSIPDDKDLDTPSSPETDSQATDTDSQNISNAQPSSTPIVLLPDVVELEFEEEGLVYRISNPDQIADLGAFYEMAESGDAVVVYEQNEMAILVRPPENKIVTMAEITGGTPERTVIFGQESEAAQQSDVAATENNKANEDSEDAATDANPDIADVNTPTLAEDLGESVSEPESEVAPAPAIDSPSATLSPVVTVEVRNGSGQNGAASRMATQISALGDVDILQAGNAANFDYAGILVVNLAGNRLAEQVQDYAQSLGAEYDTALPAGELGSLAEMVVIVGQ